MLQLTIPIPNLPEQQDIEIEMAVNGRRQKLRYRVEVIRWADYQVAPEARADCIRDLLAAYDRNWVIHHIGMPTDHYVPLTLIRQRDWAALHQWLWREV